MHDHAPVGLLMHDKLASSIDEVEGDILATKSKLDGAPNGKCSIPSPSVTTALEAAEHLAARVTGPLQ